MNKDSKIYIAGHSGMIGSAILRELKRRGYKNIVYRKHQEMDLCNTEDVDRFFNEERPEYVFLCAAKVGNITDTLEFPVDYFFENTMIQLNVMNCARAYDVKKLEFIASSWIYPKNATQPIKESSLLTDSLEKSYEPYAIAKIAGLKYCSFIKEQYGKDFFTVVPTNTYGIADNYDTQRSHVIPAIIRRFHEAKEEGKSIVSCWGDGSPLRDFIYADDLGERCVYFMENGIGNRDFVNVATGRAITIKEITEIIADVVGYKGEIEWDVSKPAGSPKMLLGNDKTDTIEWRPKVDIEEGVKITYRDFLENWVKK